MIPGHMQGFQARISVPIRLAHRSDVEIEFVIDTGFEGALTMSPDLISDLRIPYFEEMKAKLANGETVSTDVHVANVLWDGQDIEVAVLAMGVRPLLGTALLAGKELVIQFVPDGLVTVDEI